MMYWLITGTEEDMRLTKELYAEILAQQPDNEAAKVMNRLLQSAKLLDETERQTVQAMKAENERSHK